MLFRSEDYRTTTCTACETTIDLSEQDTKPYVYCPYCRALMLSDGRLVPGTHEHRVCPECLLFDRVQTHSFFSFVLVVWSFRRAQMCPHCAERRARMALLTNALFLLGVAPALWALFWARRARSTEFLDLHRANVLARKGEYEEADGLYEVMLHSAPRHPGLLLNQAVAHANGADRDGAYDYVDRCLEACSNYEPALDFEQILHIVEENR